MKRTHPGTGSGFSTSKITMTSPDDSIPDAGDDEMLATLGYKVRAADMADVAQKLEQLEMAMADAGSTVDDNDNASPLAHLAFDAVHYNPSDLSSWLENMLTELNVPPPPPPSHQIYGSNDLTAIVPVEREKKKAKSEPAPAPVALIEEPTETGVRLVHTLQACAAFVQEENLTAAAALVKDISVLAMSQSGPMRKVATFFAEALARRIYKIQPSPVRPEANTSGEISDVLESHFYEACPYLKFAHFTANQAILEAFSGKSRVHVVDFGMKEGIQWPALMQALALRPGGPPVFRLTGIGPPQPDNSDALQQVGWKLAELAKMIGIEFEYRGFVAASLADIEPYMFPTDDDAVAVNSMFELHRLLSQPGSLEKVLSTIKSMKPIIVTVAEQEANHNAPLFLNRFNEALHYYSSMFDSLEGGSCSTDGKDQAMAEVYLGRQICDVLGCEGVDRTERHQTAEQWRGSIVAGGFEQVPFGSNAFKQASLLLELFAGSEGYRVEENEGFLMLGWHTRPLVTASAWRFPVA